MASFWTNKGAFRLLQLAAGGTLPTNFYIALCTGANTPTRATNVMSDLVQIAAGNGYTSGGFQLTPGSHFTVTEVDGSNLATLAIDDDLVEWTASGDPIPASGDGARWAVLTDDNGTVADREVWAVFDLSSDRSVEDTFTLSLDSLVLRGLTNA